MFYKFPRTPILALHGDQSFRGEHILSFEDAQEFLKHKIIIEEKIDGANLGISFDTDGNIKLQNRGDYLIEPLHGQWKVLPEWLVVHDAELFDILTDKYILFGEWCYAKHSIFYSKLPDYFVAFDIFDKENEKFFLHQNEI